MQAFKEKVQSIISKYEEPLAANGVKISVSQKYVESEVAERSTSYADNGTALFGEIDRAMDRRREKKNNYNHVRNRYYCIVLSLLPTDKNRVRKELCKEYGFVLRKVERAHLGQEPQRIQYNEENVLSKIEKRMLKILKRSGKVSAQKVCQDTIWDAFRYSIAPQYTYKKRFLGKDRGSWEIIFILSVGVPVLAVVFILWGIGKLR